MNAKIGDTVFYDEPIVNCPVCGEYISHLCDITMEIGQSGKDEIECEACGAVMSIEVDYTWSGSILKLPSSSRTNDVEKEVK